MCVCVCVCVCKKRSYLECMYTSLQEAVDAEGGGNPVPQVLSEFCVCVCVCVLVTMFIYICTCLISPD